MRNIIFLEHIVPAGGKLKPPVIYLKNKYDRL